jgi:hypothetical protein
MQAGNRAIRSLVALVVVALGVTPVALAAPGGVPGKPAGTPSGKPEGAGKPDKVPGGHGKPEGAGKPEGTPGGGPPAEPDPTLTGDTGDVGAPAGHGKGPTGRTVAYVFKGVYEGEGETAGEAGVAVDHGNKRARPFAGQTVTFDLSAARLSVADTDGSGTVDLADVFIGDRVVVKAKLSKSDPGAQPFPAKQLVDETNPAPDEDE